MAFIFMDESGDLGFDFNKKKTSKVFIITFYPALSSLLHRDARQTNF
jgi:L-asparaginase/Glu-tRNA(Gln) amidotransferase subunit D